MGPIDVWATHAERQRRVERVRERLALAMVELDNEIRQLEENQEDTKAAIAACRSRRTRLNVLVDLDSIMLEQVLEAVREEHCPGCDRRGNGIRQQPDGALTCSVCGRTVVAADQVGEPDDVL